MEGILLVTIVVMIGLVRILDFREAGAAIILRPTSPLLVAKILTSSRCKKPCGRAVRLKNTVE